MLPFRTRPYGQWDTADDQDQYLDSSDYGGSASPDTGGAYTDFGGYAGGPPPAALPNPATPPPTPGPPPAGTADATDSAPAAANAGSSDFGSPITPNLPSSVPGGGAPPLAPGASPQQGFQSQIAALGPPPVRPQGNWAQRIATAILKASPRLSPAADWIVHPKYAGQEAAYEQGVGRIAQQEQMREAEERVAAQAQERQSRAMELQSKANQLTEDAETRRLKIQNQPIVDAQKAAQKAQDDARKRFEDATKILQMGGKRVPTGTPTDPNVTALPDPTDPNFMYVIPPTVKNQTIKLKGPLADFVGVDSGTEVPHDIWLAASTGYAKQQEVQSQVEARKAATEAAAREAAARLAETREYHQGMLENRQTESDRRQQQTDWNVNPQNPRNQPKQGRSSWQSRIPGGGAPPQNGSANANRPAANVPPKNVTDALPPGVHKFANGQIWRKGADGSMTQVGNSLSGGDAVAR